MHTYLKKSAKCYPDLIWNDEALGFKEGWVTCTRRTGRTSKEQDDMGSVPDAELQFNITYVVQTSVL